MLYLTQSPTRNLAGKETLLAHRLHVHYGRAGRFVGFDRITMLEVFFFSERVNGGRVVVVEITTKYFAAGFTGTTYGSSSKSLYACGLDI